MINSNQQQSQFNQGYLEDKCQEKKITEPQSSFFGEYEPAKQEDLASQDLLSWFWLTHSQLSSFKSGVFWGLIVSFTAMISGLIGASLITITSVGSNFISKLDNNHKVNLGYKLLREYQKQLFLNPKAINITYRLNRPFNLLLIGIKPDRQAIKNFPTTLVGESQTIWLLQFQPERDLVKVINIPIDSLVQIPGFGRNTIKNAHKYGGTPLVSQVVSQLVDNINIDAYITATPKALENILPELEAITANYCSSATYSQNQTLVALVSSPSQANKLNNCRSKSAQFHQQRLLWKTMGQKLQQSTIRDRFSHNLLTASKYLDTNISPQEILSLTDFIAQLPSSGLQVSLLSDNYESQVIPELEGTISKNQLFNHKFSLANSQLLDQQKTSLAADKWRNVEIAVQNTTDDPQLSLRLISYLNQQGFAKVYLAEYLPLNLTHTEIVLPPSRINFANHLQEVLGMGNLAISQSQPQKTLTIRIGKDAQDIIPNNSFIR